MLYVANNQGAFVAPVDIQAFTLESKSELLSRCQGKTVRYFTQAVKEICEAFEELHEKKSGGSGDDRDQKAIPAISSGSIMVDTTTQNKMDNMVDVGAELELSSHLEGGADRCGKKLRIHVEQSNVTSPVFANNKLLNDAEHMPKEDGISKFNPYIKEEAAENKDREEMSACRELVESARGLSSSPYSGIPDFRAQSDHSSDGGKRDDSIPIVAFQDKKFIGRLKSSKDGHELKESGVELKRKFKDSADHVEASDSGPNGTQKFKSLKMKVVKSLQTERKNLNASKNSLKDVVASCKRHIDNDDCGQKKSGQLGPQKHDDVNEILIPPKRPRNVDSVNNKMILILKNGKNSVSAPNANERKLEKIVNIVKADVDFGIKHVKGNFGHGTAGNEALSPLAKRCRKELEVMPDSSDGHKILPPGFNKIEVLKKRRAIRLYDEEEEPKTPVHVHPASKVNISSVSDSVRYGNGNHDFSDSNGEGLNKAAGRDKNNLPKEHVLSTIPPSISSLSASLLLTSGISKKIFSSRSPGELESAKVPCNGAEAALVSPKTSPEVAVTDNKFIEERSANVHSVSPTRSPHVVEQKAARYLIKESGVVAQSKTQYVSGKEVSISKNKLPAAAERSKGTPKRNYWFTESVASVDRYRQNDSSIGGRIDGSLKEKVSLGVDVKSSDTAMSIKHLIAVARNAHILNLSHGNTGSVSPSANAQGCSSSPPSSVFTLGAKNAMQLDLQGSDTRPSFVSPSHNQEFASAKQLDVGDQGDRRHDTGHEAGGGSLSGGTDAAVNRDAFEGMIETLSRTKESIRRATRLAIDCAKHGIANEVLDLLIRKLENEPCFHRRVDIFFLVDSITQCSHCQKGVAGASYIPAVQAALPRLLSAAAPSGASARENRRQCLKVLRLWLERKILPESVLRCFMDDIGVSNDDVYSGLSLRRPARSERGVDDPIRQIEGILDEYGSNASYPLFGLSKRYNDDEEDEEDVPITSCKQTSGSPSDKESTLSEFETGIASPCDMDGELEMEDVSGHPKDEKVFIIGSSSIEMQECHVDRELGIADDLDEALSLNGSPPLPLEPPPPLPPLPSSPPPPLPQLSLSPLPPPHPSLPPPLSAHLPPPPLPSQGPLQSGRLLPSLPPRGPASSFTSHLLLQPSTSLSASSIRLTFQTPGNEFSSMPSGNQPVQMAVNTSQQSCSFYPLGISAPHESAAFSSSQSLKYGHDDMFTGPQAARSKQHFQPGHAPFSQAPFLQVRPPQTPANHRYPYNKSSIQQNLRLPYPHPYSSPSLPDRTRFVAEKQRKASSAEYKAGSHRVAWLNRGRTAFGARGAF
ncbi:ENHANCER OF AG-4 protein [Dionaea muscipula]